MGHLPRALLGLPTRSRGVARDHHASDVGRLRGQPSGGFSAALFATTWQRSLLSLMPR